MASSKAFTSSLCGRQLYHQAVAYKSSGSECASKAGSKVLPPASATYRTMSWFFPLVGGEAATATAFLMFSKCVVATPMHCPSYKHEATYEDCTKCLVHTPASLRAWTLGVLSFTSCSLAFCPCTFLRPPPDPQTPSIFADFTGLTFPLALAAELP